VGHSELEKTFEKVRGLLRILLKNPPQKRAENGLFAWFVYIEASARTFLQGKGVLLKLL